MGITIKNNKCIMALLVLLFAVCTVSAHADIDVDETYKQLGRKPSKHEMHSKEIDYHSKVLHEELSIIVRSFVAIGETPSKEAVSKVRDYLGEPTPYYLVKEEFETWINKYGSMESALKLLNLNLSEEALFAKLIDMAVEEVYGNLYYSTPADKRRLAAYYSSLGVTEYKPMVGKMVKNMNPDMKKEIIKDCLKKNGRADLASNEKFMKKMQEQDVSYMSLDKLFSKI